MNRVIQFVTKKEWAAFIGFTGAVVTFAEQQAETLPADVRPYIVSGLVLIGGFITRAKVWSQNNLPS